LKIEAEDFNILYINNIILRFMKRKYRRKHK